MENITSIAKMIPWIWLLMINVAGILICLIDKRRAVKNKWRIPERNIFLVAILGGSVGVLIGMYTFRHKTKHMKFVIGIPAILILEVALAILSRVKLGQ